ncbi:hypothetical protein JXB01_04305 [Candidatus Micrarchaeota archaeon]|nr:hypothetical protein [Candidatus Micrarchaeota archaeon]
MIEKLLFGGLSLPGEMVRIAVVLIGTAAATYYDLFNNKNIPDWLLYGFLGIAFAVNIIFFQFEITVFGIATALIAGLVGYLFYRMGHIGGADVMVLSSIALLLPIHPSTAGMIFNYPFIFSVLVYSGVIFAAYMFADFSLKILKTGERKPNLIYLLMLLPLALFMYTYLNFPIFSPVYFLIVFIMVVSTMFFLVFKEDINKLLAEKVPLDKVDNEDVLAVEMMDKEFIDKYRPERVLTEKEISRLKKLKVKEVIIYKHLPPFLPFILIAVVVSLYFADFLILS